MHSGPDNSGGNTRRQIPITDQADAGPSGTNISNQFFMPRAIEHDDDQVFHVAIHPLRDVFQIVGHGSVEIDGVLARRSDHNFFHVAVGSVEQSSMFRGGEYGDRSRRTSGAEIRALQRINRNVDLGDFAPIGKLSSNLFADIKHGRFVSLALTNDDGAAHGDRVHGVTHGFGGHFI